jgi:cellulose synthase/poly-beta-1,6-N-acetylglucosamine synthase-like glycosyltransferase
VSALLVIAATAVFALTLPVAVELALFLLANLLPGPSSRRRGEPPAPGGGPMSLAVLVPAHDEEKDIGRCVTSLLASERGVHRLDVVVIADNCGDGTADAARRAGARVIERRDESVRGKGAALHHAISMLMPEEYDAFIVVDADTVVSSDFAKRMGDHFAGGKGAIQCVYLPLNADASPRTRLMNLALLSMNVFRPAGRERLGLSAGIFGNGFGLRKELLRDVPYTANSITEDLEYHLRLIEKGYRVRFVDDARVLADFPISKAGAETQRARWEGGRFMLQRKFMPRMLGDVVRGKASMIEPFLELVSLPLSYETLLLLALAAIPGHPFRIYAACALIVLAAQILAAVALYGKGRDLLAVFEIPSYLFWKIVKLPRILATSRKGSTWVRTKRD